MDVLITGSTGMVGKSVLYECIEDDRINKIYLINRSANGIKNLKISELIIKDFLSIKNIKSKIKKLAKIRKNGWGQKPVCE